MAAVITSAVPTRSVSPANSAAPQTKELPRPGLSPFIQHTPSQRSRTPMIRKETLICSMPVGEKIASDCNPGWKQRRSSRISARCSEGTGPINTHKTCRTGRGQDSWYGQRHSILIVLRHGRGRRRTIKHDERRQSAGCWSIVSRNLAEEFDTLQAHERLPERGRSASLTFLL